MSIEKLLQDLTTAIRENTAARVAANEMMSAGLARVTAAGAAAGEKTKAVLASESGAVAIGDQPKTPVVVPAAPTDYKRDVFPKVVDAAKVIGNDGVRAILAELKPGAAKATDIPTEQWPALLEKLAAAVKAKQ